MKSKSFIMCLEVKEGSSAEKVFEQMKQMQKQTEYADNTVVIAYNQDIKLVAGFYDTFEEFFELFFAVMYRDKDKIKEHVATYFTKLNSDEIRIAIDYINNSLKHWSVGLTNEEISELYKLAGGRSRA